MCFVDFSLFTNVQARAMAVIQMFLSNGSEFKFYGVRFDNCANRPPMISQAQYKYYCTEFGLRHSIRMTTNLKVEGIVGDLSVVGKVTMQITFVDPHLLIDVDFLVLRENIPTLCSMQNMNLNGLDIYLKKRHVSHVSRVHKFMVENYFLIHRCRKDEIPYILFFETDLRKIHRFF